MDLDTPHISPNGELISKRELIAEIENLLNGVGQNTQTKSRDSHNADALSQTTLSVEIMATLGFEELLSLRNSLLQKDCLQENKEWLLGLSQKP